MGAVLCDNRYHFIHHSRDPADFGSNFAVRFPFIDKLFGTYRPPRSYLPDTGLPDRSPPANIRQYVFASWPPEESRADIRHVEGRQHPCFSN